MVVNFYKTTKNGSEVLGSVTYTGTKITGPSKLIKLLFKDDPSQMTVFEITDIFKNAPVRFDGAYLRAEYKD